MSSVLDAFDSVRVINLADRLDRKRDMEVQIVRSGVRRTHVKFYTAERPASAGEFPSSGARGCFESHLTILREALRARVRSVLLLEDDVNFSRDCIASATHLREQLGKSEWDIFYGAHLLPRNGRNGLVTLEPDVPVLTASFVAFDGGLLPSLVDFLSGLERRRAGSPDFGPMHVDGAYSVFRSLHPEFKTWAAFPTLGKQRKSSSDITPKRTILESRPSTSSALAVLRRLYNWIDRQ